MLNIFKNIKLYDDSKDKLSALSENLKTLITLFLNIKSVKISVLQNYKYRIYVDYEYIIDETSNIISLYLDPSSKENNINLKYTYSFDNHALDSRFISLIHRLNTYNISVTIDNFLALRKIFIDKLYSLFYDYCIANNLEDDLTKELERIHLENTILFINSIKTLSLDEKESLLKNITRRVVLERIL